MVYIVKNMKKKYYVVWEGRKVGVFDSWEECKKSIDNFSNAKYKSFKSLVEANDALVNKAKYIYDEVMNISEPSIVVDASYIISEDKMEYRGILMPERKVIFHKGPYFGATNNIGEFLAIVHALAFLKRSGKKLPVFTDSNVALHWIKKKDLKINKNASPVILELATRALKWLNENNIEDYEIKKWNTKKLGEIPADFGRK